MNARRPTARTAAYLWALPLGVVSAVACGPAPAPAPQPGAQAVHPPRPRPSEHGMAHGFERVQGDAVRCLRPGDSVRVAGRYDGPTGNFHADRVESASGPLPYAVETCVRVAAERAHVRPFLEPAAAYTYTFTLPGGTSGGSAGGTNTARPYTPPTLVSGNMSINAGPSPVELIRRDGDALQRCYEQACERDHTVAGGVEVHLTLDARGAVTQINSRVSTTHEDPTLMDLVARCIESHIRLIAFGPQTTPNVEIVVPLEFNPGGVPIE